MKTNFVNLLFLLLLAQVSSNQLFGQADGCQFSENAYKRFLQTNPQRSMAGCCQPDPGGSTEAPVKFINVNVHFLLSTSVSNPGNFTEDDGHSFAEAVINNMNDNWKKNYQSAIYLGMDTDPNALPPDFPPKGIQVLLKEVHFDRNDGLFSQAQSTNSNTWGSGSILQGPLGQNGGEEFNIYFVETPLAGGDGLADWDSGQPFAVIYDAFTKYNQNGNTYNFAKVANHELGHLFGLSHVFSCSNECNGIDINSPKECKPQINNPSGCSSCWGRWQATNNLMNYSNYAHALTPCQIDVMQQTIEDQYCNYVGHCQYDYTVCPIICCGDRPGIIVKGLCPQPTAHFDISNSTVEACDPNDVEVWMDGRSSWKEQNYTISVSQVFPFGTNNQTTQTFTGKVGLVDLADFLNYQFDVGGIYEVYLEVENACGADGILDYITIEDGDCSLACLEVEPIPCTEANMLCLGCWQISGVPFNENCITWDVEVVYNGSLYQNYTFEDKSKVAFSHPCGSDINICVQLCDLEEPCDDMTKCFSFQDIGGFGPGENPKQSVSRAALADPLRSAASPNPFTDATTLQFEMPNDASASIEVFDLRGRLVFATQDYFATGSHTYVLDQLPAIAKGLLIYQISTEEEVLSTGRMLRLD